MKILVDEILVEVTPEGQWITNEKQRKKGKGWSPFMPIEAMSIHIAHLLGEKDVLRKGFKFKIVKVK